MLGLRELSRQPMRRRRVPVNILAAWSDRVDAFEQIFAQKIAECHLRLHGLALRPNAGEPISVHREDNFRRLSGRLCSRLDAPKGACLLPLWATGGSMSLFTAVPALPVADCNRWMRTAASNVGVLTAVGTLAGALVVPGTRTVRNRPAGRSIRPLLPLLTYRCHQILDRDLTVAVIAVSIDNTHQCVAIGLLLVDGRYGPSPSALKQQLGGLGDDGVTELCICDTDLS